MNQLKVCAKCKQIKSVSDFSTDKTNKSGLQSWCRACKAAWARQYYRTTKGKLAHNRSRQRLTEQQQAKIGAYIADMLGLRQNQDGKYYTTWGRKTPLGLYLTIQRIILDNRY